ADLAVDALLAVVPVVVGEILTEPGVGQETDAARVGSRAPAEGAQQGGEEGGRGAHQVPWVGGGGGAAGPGRARWRVEPQRAGTARARERSGRR
ncbi:MAG: hypothetical protein ACK559_10485, partial [bacterium]